eukprot:1159084-Pelagomonas_calceolata.AAC.8
MPVASGCGLPVLPARGMQSFLARPIGENKYAHLFFETSPQTRVSLGPTGLHHSEVSNEDVSRFLEQDSNQMSYFLSDIVKEVRCNSLHWSNIRVGCNGLHALSSCSDQPVPPSVFHSHLHNSKKSIVMYPAWQPGPSTQKTNHITTLPRFIISGRTWLPREPLIELQSLVLKSRNFYCSMCPVLQVVPPHKLKDVPLSHNAS